VIEDQIIHSSEPNWVRDDGSIIVSMGSGHHVDISTDFGNTWDALRPGEAKSLAEGLGRIADAVDLRDTE
jgi:hypothetical protein